MPTHDCKRLGREDWMRIALQALALVAMCAFWAFAEAQPLADGLPAGDPGELAPAQLEKAFRACDYATTTGGPMPLPASACSVVSERLVRQKFGDDLEAFLGWWRANKAAEHRKLERALAR